MSQALYRKYRSKSLAEIVGQQHITDILQKAISSDRLSHAYLLTGPRGVGKTSIARILAHSINELPYDEEVNHLDIIEIDAASNNGVEDVRDLREKVRLAPVSASKKVYIIDEVHMLSKAAFNALLKTLEEPPEHVVFILATTDANKLPDTIISRTQRFNFRSIAVKDAVEHLRTIAKAEKIKIDDQSLQIIAQRGEGSFRDSISLLDQLSSLSDEKEGITSELTEKVLGLAPNTSVQKILDYVIKSEPKQALQLLEELFSQGIDASILASQTANLARQKVVESPNLLNLIDSLLDVPKNSDPELKLIVAIGLASTTEKHAKSAALIASPLEIKASVQDLQKDQKPEQKEESKQETKKQDQPKEEAKPKQATVKKQAHTNSGDLDWKSLIAYTKDKHVALYSVLVKCGYTLEENKLTIHAGNSLFKNKLDDMKYRRLLEESLSAVGASGLDIHTLPTPLPPKDSQAAAVAAIMGGGEEVSI